MDIHGGRSGRHAGARRAAILSKIVLLAAVLGIIFAVGCTQPDTVGGGGGTNIPLITSGGDHNYEVYYVEKGDTLSSIGRRTGVPWEKIQEVNDCDPRDLSAGQVLLIPLHAREEPPQPEQLNTRTYADRGSGASGTVVIDPGHGGRDPGAISPYGPEEKTVNLAIAQEVARILRRDGCRVTMTRKGDAFVTLNQRASIANRLNADLFVSIHANSSRDHGVSGYEVYVCEGASSMSHSAARSVERALSGVGFRSRGIKTANYHVLVNTEVPAILVETGFLSNRSQARALTDSSTQDSLARHIADGILSAL
ncbi:MAG: N-acetylmuramoyl-L-alanine amidase [Planctomycetota bacterium]